MRRRGKVPSHREISATDRSWVFPLLPIRHQIATGLSLSAGRPGSCSVAQGPTGSVNPAETYLDNFPNFPGAGVRRSRCGEIPGQPMTGVVVCASRQAV